jgi:hypothetical protein
MTLFRFFHLFDLHWIKLVCGFLNKSYLKVIIWIVEFMLTYVGFLHDIFHKDLDLIMENKYQG